MRLGVVMEGQGDVFHIRHHICGHSEVWSADYPKVVLLIQSCIHDINTDERIDSLQWGYSACPQPHHERAHPLGNS